MAHGCGEGDLLFLPLDGPEPRHCHVVRAVDRHRETGIRRLALDVGADPDTVDDETPSAVAAALGLPRGADWTDITDRLNERGDPDVANVPSTWR